MQDEGVVEFVSNIARTIVYVSPGWRITTDTPWMIAWTGEGGSSCKVESGHQCHQN